MNIIDKKGNNWVNYMNDVVKFVPDGSYDDLIFRFMNIMLKIRESCLIKTKESDFFQDYTSYLPREKFDEMIKIGFQMARDHTVPEYINFCYEGIQANYTRLQLGEIIVLKQLLPCTISEDFDEFENIYVAMCSLDMNKIITTKLYNCGIINMNSGETFNIEIITNKKTED